MGMISQAAYVDAERAIFMQDNVVADVFKNALSIAERSKKFPNAGPAVARIGRFLVPIVKVPTNIVGEVATGVHGLATGSIRAGKAYLKGIESLPPEQADSILRQLKKGAIGNALLLTGYFGYQSIGGFFQKNDKRNQSSVQPGHFRVGSVDLPSFVSHSTAAMLLEMGATAHRQEIATGSKAKGVGSAVRGEIAQLPFVPAVTSIATALESDEGMQKYIRDMVTSSAVPAVVAHAAKVEDTPGKFFALPSNAFKPANKRYPKTIGQGIKAQIPWARRSVPNHR